MHREYEVAASSESVVDYFTGFTSKNFKIKRGHSDELVAFTPILFSLSEVDHRFFYVNVNIRIAKTLDNAVVVHQYTKMHPFNYLTLIAVVLITSFFGYSYFTGYVDTNGTVIDLKVFLFTFIFSAFTFFWFFMIIRYQESELIDRVSQHFKFIEQGT